MLQVLRRHFKSNLLAQKYRLFQCCSYFHSNSARNYTILPKNHSYGTELSVCSPYFGQSRVTQGYATKKSRSNMQNEPKPRSGNKRERFSHLTPLGCFMIIYFKHFNMFLLQYNKSLFYFVGIKCMRKV